MSVSTETFFVVTSTTHKVQLRQCSTAAADGGDGGADDGGVQLYCDEEVV